MLQQSLADFMSKLYFYTKVALGQAKNLRFRGKFRKKEKNEISSKIKPFNHLTIQPYYLSLEDSLVDLDLN